MTKYKVALNAGRWKRGFVTLEAATKFHDALHRKDGVFRAVQAYEPKVKYLDRDGIVSRVIGIVSDGVRWKRPSLETANALFEQVWRSRDWERMTASDRSFVNGYHAAYRRFVLDSHIESGSWFPMPDGSIVYHAAFDPLPDGISWRYLNEHQIRERSGLYWKSSPPGTHPYFLDQPSPAAIQNPESEKPHGPGF